MCTNVHYPERMTLRRLSTKQYDADARERLARTVTRAREAAGFKSRQALADAAGVSVRSLADLEQAVPRVGQQTLEAVARVLPGWTEDTPRVILGGGEAPTIDRRETSWADRRRLAVQDLARLIADEVDITTYLRAQGRHYARLGEDTDMQQISREAQDLAKSWTETQGDRAKETG